MACRGFRFASPACGIRLPRLEATGRSEMEDGRWGERNPLPLQQPATCNPQLPTPRSPWNTSCRMEVLRTLRNLRERLVRISIAMESLPFQVQKLEVGRWEMGPRSPTPPISHLLRPKAKIFHLLRRKAITSHLPLPGRAAIAFPFIRSRTAGCMMPLTARGGVRRERSSAT